ncbi:DUF3995 domain-containing protein [Aliiroseovarius sp. S1339]|uniref:DUF3995 domain-containing protein n=1 Tax=Aliiroseovarius sp. S1339 TaxID=2936990 RepID=UPI0020BFF3BD|nr:DUF3995 domain-containing protein [Aliiroseovarius sp. S1339]MCK8463902.1 DUF3995 domain-containing protein [Aliiroseovarius sp. S1339]
MSVLASILIATLLVIAAIHMVWGAGLTWPVANEALLARTVVGQKGIAHMPPGWASFAVAGALGVATVITADLIGWVGLLPSWITRGAVWMMVAVFAIRGAASYVLALLRVPVEEPFARLDLILYGPLCLAIAAGLWVLL